jgi:L-serine/L-threonine ammonia-lyase
MNDFALHIPTPLIESRPLSTRSSKSFWLKMEAMQTPGSFKIRGIGLACQEYARRGAKRFISSSGGNAGIAVAYAGRRLQVPVTVVVPLTASERAKALIRLEGAEVIVHGASWNEANALALSMVGKDDAFLHPFDNPLLWRGHATLVDEVAASGLKPDAVVLSVGGGGLLCGVVEGLQRNGWSDVPVIAAETQGAESFALSLKENRRVELPAITSIATSLGSKQVAERAFALAKEHPIHSVVVSDQAAVSACLQFLENHRVLTEPACGASLAVAYDCPPAIASFDKLLVVVCGGVTATVEQLRAWHAGGKPPLN